MTLAKAKAGANKTIVAQASLTIVSYDHQNMFKVQSTEAIRLFCGLYYKHITIVNYNSRVVSEFCSKLWHRL
jgi:hypothetical protein